MSDNAIMPLQTANDIDDQRSILLHSVRIAYAKMYTERLSCRRVLTAAREPLSKLSPTSTLCARESHSIPDLQALIKDLESQTQHLIALTQETRSWAKKKEDAETEKLSQQYRVDMQSSDEKMKKKQIQKDAGENVSDKQGALTVERGQMDGAGRPMLKINRESENVSGSDSDDLSEDDDFPGASNVDDDSSPKVMKK